MKYFVKRHEHIFEPEAFFPKCHASTIEILPSGDIVAAWFAGSHEGAADVEIWLAIRHNDAWSAPQVVASGNGIPCWNPVLLESNGVLTLFYKVGKEIPTWQTMYKTSADGGHTWSDAKELVPGDVGGRGPVKNKCLRLHNGAILAPSSWESETQWECFMDVSTDGGRTWQPTADVPRSRDDFTGKGMIQPTLWQDDDGVVHMLARSTEGAIFASKSLDDGYTWETAWKTDLPNNNCGIDVARLDDGRLVLVYNPVAGNWAARSPIAFAVSCDNGNSWSAPQILDHVPCDPKVNIEATEFSYPAVLARGNDVFITYTWKRQTLAFWHIAVM